MVIMSVNEYYDKIIRWLWNDEYPDNLDAEKKREFRKTVKNYERGSHDNDFLFYWINGIKLRVLLNETDRANAIPKAHVNEKGRHLNKKQTIYRLCAELKFHWKDIDSDVDAYIKNSCSTCFENQPPLEENITVDKAGTKILVMEILGPVALSKRGNRFIGVLIEVDTRWINAIPMANYATSEFAALLHESLGQFGWCKMYFIGMDPNFIRRLDEDIEIQKNTADFNNDDEFISKVILTREANDSKSIENVLGLTFENVLNRYIPAVHKHVCMHPENWDRSLHGLACDLRNHVWEDLGYSPFYAFFLQKPQSNVRMSEISFSLSDEEDSEDGEDLCNLKSKL